MITALYLGALLCFALIIAIALAERRRIDPADYERATTLCEMTEHGGLYR
jgi:hypothetical protein